MAGPKTDRQKLTRRDFLKLAGVGFLATAGVSVQHNWPRINKFWDEGGGAMLTGRVEDLDQITSEVPKQLENLTIPTENEWFKNADDILVDGLSLYKEWMSNDSSLPKPHYEQAENYVEAPSMAYKLSSKITQSPELLKDGPLGIFGYLVDASTDLDIPYSMIFHGSGSGITSIQQLIEIDPGTQLVKDIRQSMKEKFGDDFDIWSACRYGPLTEEQRAHFTDIFKEWYSGAMEYVQAARNKSSEPISTNVLFAYFLHKNHGDILSSTWDTSTWLKILVRNDPDNNLKRDPTYDRAALACFLFKDEFSPTVSANWVIDNVDENDQLLNYVEDPNAYFQYKDYMPPNRAGGFYHAWNIMALCMSMTPFLAKRMVAVQTNPSLGDDGYRWTEYGKVKSKADMLVADQAEEIDRIVHRYD